MIKTKNSGETMGNTLTKEFFKQLTNPQDSHIKKDNIHANHFESNVELVNNKEILEINGKYSRNIDKLSQKKYSTEISVSNKLKRSLMGNSNLISNINHNKSNEKEKGIIIIGGKADEMKKKNLNLSFDRQTLRIENKSNLTIRKPILDKVLDLSINQAIKTNKNGLNPKSGILKTDSKSLPPQKDRSQSVSPSNELGSLIKKGEGGAKQKAVYYIYIYIYIFYIGIPNYCC